MLYASSRHSVCTPYSILMHLKHESCEAMKKGISIVLLAVTCLLLLPCPAWAWSGKVIGVADGDTITVLHEQRPERIRLYGIDCPEKRQAFGKKAKLFISHLAFGKTADVEPLTRDRYGRTIALVRVDNVELNEKLIEEGLAWVYLAYCKSSRCHDWEILQLKAREGKHGLWQDTSPVPPWEFRRHR
jgi:micrococcal nuclease